MPSPSVERQTILFLAANPKDTGRLRLDQELRDIAEGLQRAQKRDQFHLEQRLAVRPRDIQRAILDVGPQIIHFSGHGTGVQGLVLEDEIGNAKLVDGAALAGLFDLFADRITCVVLNGCYLDVQAEAIAQYIPYVIGMNQAIGDKAAIAFAVGFYDALGAGRDVEFAYKLGCAAVMLEGNTENLTPILLKSDHKPRPSQRSPDAINRRRLCWILGLCGVGTGFVLLLPSLQSFHSTVQPSPEVSPPLPLTSFSFDVITVNAQGKETGRQRKQAQFFEEDLGDGVRLEMVVIEGGKFVMGSPPNEKEREDNEEPQHSVSVKPFWIGMYTVTQAQWETVAKLPKIDRDLKLHPSYFRGIKLPVERVSWQDAIEFCARLSKRTGHKYRLPTEAEWEFACRAGTTTPFYFGETITTDLANYRGMDWKDADGKIHRGFYDQGPRGDFLNQTKVVGSFPPNAFGLYNLHGNVWEWCQDCWHENYDEAPIDGSARNEGGNSKTRVIRGGSWFDYPSNCRSARRNQFDLATSLDGIGILNSIGFRIVCDPL